MSSGELWNITLRDTSRSSCPENGTSWQNVLAAFEVLNIIQLVIAAWVLFCMVIYGTKTRRWTKKPRGSSLNSGMIYTLCTIAVALFIPKLTAMEIIYSLPGMENGTQSCELACDISNVAYTISTTASYSFLWMRQRLIYDHPYVKPRVNRRVKWFSNVAAVFLAILAVALLCFYVLPMSYEGRQFGCVRKSDSFISTEGKNIILAVCLLSAQFIILGLSIYPMVHVKFEATNEGVEIPLSSDYDGAERKKSIQEHLTVVSKFIKRTVGTEAPKSPIELAVRRTMISSVVIVVTDVLALIPPAVMSRCAPVVLRSTIFDLGSFVNIFCMLATFGFASRVLTLLCPTWPKIKRRWSKNKDGREENTVVAEETV